MHGQTAEKRSLRARESRTPLSCRLRLIRNEPFQTIAGRIYQNINGLGIVVLFMGFDCATSKTCRVPFAVPPSAKRRACDVASPDFR